MEMEFYRLDNLDEYLLEDEEEILEQNAIKAYEQFRQYIPKHLLPKNDNRYRTFVNVNVGDNIANLFAFLPFAERSYDRYNEVIVDDNDLKLSFIMDRKVYYKDDFYTFSK